MRIEHALNALLVLAIGASGCVRQSDRGLVDPDRAKVSELIVEYESRLDPNLRGTYRRRVDESRYLGAVNTADGRLYHLVYYAFSWSTSEGCSIHQTHKLLVFDGRSDFLAECNVYGDVRAEGCKVVGTDLILDVKEPTAETRSSVSLSFADGLPHQVPLHIVGTFFEIPGDSGEK